MPDATPNLPIDTVLPDLTAALEDGTQAILAAPPGAGKTTRVPLALLGASWRRNGKLIMLEPRRIAARSAAERLAGQLGQKVGAQVGYRIRGDSVAGSAIEVVTEGVLTRMLLSDPSLDGVAAVLFDEAHERSIHGDLGLALCLEMQDVLRPDLRLLVMSATLDTSVYTPLMPTAALIESEGRAFPITTHWLDRPWRTPGQGRRGLETTVADLTRRALDETDEGDVLVFLPGVGEIERVRALFSPRDADVCVLHGTMPFSQQRTVMVRPEQSRRRIILSTDIAETSLTVPGVRIVVDAGFARGPRVDPGTGLSRLITGPVSRASAEQRRGRAGRLGPGHCYRLWTKGEEGMLPAYAEPEIRVVDLAPLALDLAAWGTADPASLRFPTQPNPAAFAAARTLLSDLGALDGDGRLTDHGKSMAKLPLPPRLAHMMICAKADAQAETAALLVGLMSERDPMRGQSCDLRDRVRAVLTGGADAALAKQIKAEAKRHHPTLPNLLTAEGQLGRLAATAFPDRIAQRRAGDAPRYLLTNGRGAVIASDDPMSNEAYLVALNLQDDREARIRLAAPIALAELRDMFRDQIKTENNVFWAQRKNRVEARLQEKLGAIVLTDQVWRDVPGDALGAALLDGIKQCGVDALPWSKPALNLRNRAAWLNERSADVPDWSDEALLASLDAWLLPHLDGMTAISDTAGLDWIALLQATDYAGAQKVADLAPAKFTTPLERTIPIDYAGDQPRISVKVQEMFGLGHHPSVAGAPLVVELLSPAGRPVQTTADLPGFWAGSYPDVRKDMRARYPKHPWPEDPVNSDPTSRAKPRKAPRG